MRVSTFVLGLSLGVIGSANADLVDDVSDTLALCSDCLSTGGDGDCTDECNVIGNLDDAVNSCCDWWACSSCPQTKATTTTKPAPPPKTTTTTTSELFVVNQQTEERMKE